MRGSSPTLLTQTLSVVIPVYRAGPALGAVVREVLEVVDVIDLAAGVRVDLDEVVLVCDNPALTPDERQELRALEDLDRRVRTIWLARNFGQHPATIAGIVSTNGDWVVTMDEDGQHDPRHIGAMLLATAEAGVALTYAQPTNAPPHGRMRNLASRTAKRIFRRMAGAEFDFHSFRLLEGSVARSACAYVGENVYLDVALRWSCGDATTCPVPMREEHGRSSYNARALATHFWRMVVSTGTGPLRANAVAGLMVALVGLVIAVVVVQRRLSGAFPAPGWTSVMVAVLVLMGVLFVSLAVVAEYIGLAVRNTIGRPLYVAAEHVDTRVLWSLQQALQTDVRRPHDAGPRTDASPVPSLVPRA